jgi:hypothetical protein
MDDGTPKSQEVINHEEEKTLVDHKKDGLT